MLVWFATVSYDIIAAALEFFLSNPEGDVDIKAFEAYTGVGVVVNPEDIEESVWAVFL